MLIEHLFSFAEISRCPLYIEPSGAFFLPVQYCQFMVLGFVDDTSPLVFVNSYFFIQVHVRLDHDAIYIELERGM